MRARHLEGSVDYKYNDEQSQSYIPEGQYYNSETTSDQRYMSAMPGELQELLDDSETDSE
jgi:hypothetical protein